MEKPREVIKVAHPVVDGNDSGYCLKYRDEMRPDEVEFVEGDTPQPDAQAEGQSTSEGTEMATKKKPAKVPGKGGKKC